MGNYSKEKECVTKGEYMSALLLVTIAKYERESGLRFDPMPRSPVPGPGEIVPVDRRPKQWSVWVHSPCNQASPTEDFDLEFNGLDYLMAYWLRRYHGYAQAYMYPEPCRDGSSSVTSGSLINNSRNHALATAESSVT